MNLPREYFEQLLRFEGGDVDDPDDPGGRTKYGISSRAFPGVNLDRLTEAGAYDIYNEYYWLPSQAERLPQAARYAHFDSAVQHGPVEAIKQLQRALRVSADGIIGPVTQGAIGRADAGELVNRVLAQRCAHYAAVIVARHNRNPETAFKYAAGWYGRIIQIARFPSGDNRSGMA